MSSMNAGPTVLHLNLSRSWRGGERQTYLLARGLQTYEGQSFLGADPQGELWSRARDAGIPTVPLRSRSGISLGAVLRLRRHIRKTGTTIVHAHTSHAHTLAALALVGMPRVQLIVTRRVQKGVGANLFSRIKYRRVSCHVAISQAIMDLLVRDGIPQDRIVRIYSGIELCDSSQIAADPWREAQQIPRDGVVLGTVAALTEEKGMPTLLQAARSVILRAPHVYFAIVGSGPLEEELRDIARQLRISDHVFFLGFHRHVLPFLKSFDAFVLPSLSEGLGTSILDAMQMGLPIVASHTGGIPEMVQQDVNGLLFPPGDAEALAECLHSIVYNRKVRNRFGAESARRVGTFDIRETIAATHRLYQQLHCPEASR